MSSCADRFWHLEELDESDVETKRSAVADLLTRVDVFPVDDRVMSIASQSFPTILGTLDAIHLATAMIYRERQSTDERPIVFATHDKSLARAAREMHFDVIGAE